MTSMADLTTMHVGGTPSSLVTVTSEAEIIDAVRTADEEGREILILGGGSNMVVADDFNGDVIHIKSEGIENDSSACAGAWVTVQSGHEWDDFVAHSVRNEWVGIEALSGVPGSTGATPLQNVGAYGQQVSETIAQVRAWNRQTNAIDTIFLDKCDFGYRSSIFKKNPNTWVVLSVVYQLRLGTVSSPVAYKELAASLGLEVGQRTTTAALRDAVIELRKTKGMVVQHDDHDTWSVGSFFMNPRVEVAPEGAAAWPEPDGRIKVSAAWLIEQAGFARGFGLNDRARVSSKHTLALTNHNGASANDVIELARHIRDGVQNKFGITLVPEARLIGIDF